MKIIFAYVQEKLLSYSFTSFTNHTLPSLVIRISKYSVIWMFSEVLELHLKIQVAHH